MNSKAVAAPGERPHPPKSGKFAKGREQSTPQPAIRINIKKFSTIR